ncbi:hypothetical protein [Mesonia sp.]|uniref:hypothetical protein n=1 Tax=Mesonia sp. TaxID=1960830 RepID=UPI003F969CDE
MKNLILLFANTSPQEIGEMHNKLVREFTEENKNWQDNPDFLINFYDFSIEHHPDLKSDEAREEFSTLKKYKNDKDLRNHFKDTVTIIKERKNISDYLSSEYKNIIDSNSLSEVAKINEEINENSDRLNEVDVESFKTYLAVFKASKKLWSNQTKKLDPSEAAIIGDAIGGALWWWTGPAAALIAGGYSLALYNA